MHQNFCSHQSCNVELYLSADFAHHSSGRSEWFDKKLGPTLSPYIIGRYDSTTDETQPHPENNLWFVNSLTPTTFSGDKKPQGHSTSRLTVWLNK